MLNLISHTKGRTQAEDFQENSARRIWGPKRQKAGKNCKMKSFMSRTPCQIYWDVKGKTPFEKLKPIHGRIILKWIIKIRLEGRFINNV